MSLFLYLKKQSQKHSPRRHGEHGEMQKQIMRERFFNHGEHGEHGERQNLFSAFAFLRALFSVFSVFSVVNAFDFASRRAAVSPW
jgi:hypothetical protein